MQPPFWATASLWLASGLFLPAQAAAPIAAVPYYTPQNYAQGLQGHWLAPRSAELATASTALIPAVQVLCDADAAGAPAALSAARAQWGRTVGAWERLSSVAVGPLLERRSARQIDFSPTRPELILRAIAAEPVDAAALERVGTPAKGLPALEWLLWKQPVSPGSPACRYARLVATDIDHEAQALKSAWATTAELEEDEGTAAMGEALNQWIGAVEALRWRHLERPLKGGGQGGRDPAAFPRRTSGLTASSWTAQWQALRSLAVLGAGSAPRPGAGLVSFETYLRGLGLNPLADQLVRRVARTDIALKGLQPGQTARVHAAAVSLTELKQLVETEVAPALKVSLGFSDADGD